MSTLRVDVGWPNGVPSADQPLLLGAHMRVDPLGLTHLEVAELLAAAALQATRDALRAEMDQPEGTEGLDAHVDAHARLWLIANLTAGGDLALTVDPVDH